MTRRWTAMLLVVLALATHGRVNADADCLKDDASCVVAEGCPAVCCSGAPSRVSSGLRFCISMPVLADGQALAGSTNPDSGSVATEPSSSLESDMNDLTPSSEASTLSEGSNTQDPSYASGSQAPYTQAPTPAPSEGSTDNVDAFQSSTSISSSRRGLDGATTVIAVVGVIAACVILVGAVVYKRKNFTKEPLEIPGSSYHGANGSGQTPDNRSLDGMLGRASTDSMKQLPVLSMASRQDASIVRLSSPFGNGSVRISSPAHRGGSNEDFAFAVDTSSRAGSNVNVNFVDTDMEIVVQKNGVVAL